MDEKSPAIDARDRILVRTIGPVPDRGDIVVYRGPPDDVFDARVSRIVGVGGDRIEAQDGRVRIGGHPIDEAYLPADVTTDDFPATDVPLGFVFLLSDNRGNSRDSRMMGPITEDQLIGKVSFVNVPLDKVAMAAFGGSLLLLLVLGVRHTRERRPPNSGDLSTS